MQKSAVLQKTIDFINHLQNTIKKLQDENQQLKETLARGTHIQINNYAGILTFSLSSFCVLSYWQVSHASLFQP